MVIGTSGASRFSAWRCIAAAGLLGGFAGFACESESVSNDGTGGKAGAAGDAGDGGTAAGGRAGDGQGGAAGRGGSNPGGAGAAGASGGGGEAGAAGADSGCSGALAPDVCPYPESRGENGTCGVTPNAWYPIGDSAPDWPERGATASGGLALHGWASSGVYSLEGPYPKLALHEGGRVAITAGCEVYIWDSGTWQWQMPPPSFELGEAVDGCAIAIDHIGQPIFAHWNGEESNPWVGHIERWIGPRWGALPGPFGRLSASDWGPTTSLTFSRGNTPYLAWEEFYNDESEIFAVRLDTTSDLWEPIGPAPILTAGPEMSFGDPELSHGAAGELALLTNDDGGAVVLEWDGVEWLDRSHTILNVEGRRHLTHDDTGAPVVFVAGEEELLLFRWSGTRWDALEPDDATLGTLPEHVRFDAWTADDQVYVGRFANCGWTELSASARGGGVSNAPAGTWVSEPSLAVSDGRVCVAWSEDETNPVVFIRCHDLPND